MSEEKFKRPRKEASDPERKPTQATKWNLVPRGQRRRYVMCATVREA